MKKEDLSKPIPEAALSDIKIIVKNYNELINDFIEENGKYRNGKIKNASELRAIVKEVLVDCISLAFDDDLGYMLIFLEENVKRNQLIAELKNGFGDNYEKYVERVYTDLQAVVISSADKESKKLKIGLDEYIYNNLQNTFLR